MATNEKLSAVLNGLIEINNDRIEGYEKAAEEAERVDVDLQAIFYKMASESKRYKAELVGAVTRIGGEPAEGTTNMGKVYRVWMDIKAAFSGKDRQAILESCEFGEDAAQKAYKEALESDADIDTDSRQLIAEQKASLKKSHDVIKKYRDAHEAVNS